MFYIFLAGRRPFRITFSTDGLEIIADAGANAITDEETKAPAGIIGFSLNFNQISC